jgi:hypothetical protein
MYCFSQSFKLDSNNRGFWDNKGFLGSEKKERAQLDYYWCFATAK